jgi:hypothetical protein
MLINASKIYKVRAWFLQYRTTWNSIIHQQWVLFRLHDYLFYCLQFAIHKLSCKETLQLRALFKQVVLKLENEAFVAARFCIRGSRELGTRAKYKYHKLCFPKQQERLSLSSKEDEKSIGYKFKLNAFYFGTLV